MKKAYLVVCALFSLAVGAAHAVLPAGVAASFTDASTTFTDAAALFWPVFLIITGGFVVIKIVKRLIHRL